METPGDNVVVLKSELGFKFEWTFKILQKRKCRLVVFPSSGLGWMDPASQGVISSNADATQNTRCGKFRASGKVQTCQYLALSTVSCHQLIIDYLQLT